MRSWLAGVGIAMLYVLAVVASDGMELVPVRPLYDGLAPPVPYRWVDPPVDLADANEKPSRGKGEVAFAKGKSQPTSISTADGQAQAVFKTESVRVAKGEKKAFVTVTPLDPATQPKEEGVTIDGNAYRIEATYAKSGKRVEMQHKISVILRYPAHGKTVVRLDGRRWVELDTDRAEASFQAFADSDELGVFAVEGAPDAWWRQYVSYRNAGVLIVLLGLAGYLSGRRKGRRARKKQRKTRQQKRAAQRRREKG